MTNEDRLAKAVAFAAEKHKNQKRKDGTPYIYHPLMVAEIVRRYGYDIDYQIVAILHDVLEDTDATITEVGQFGFRVCEAVQLLTRLPGMKEEDYVAGILQNHMAAVVKNADKIHNLWEITLLDNVTMKRYAEKADQYYKGRFSWALDNTVQQVLAMSHTTDERPDYSDAILRRGIPNFTKQEFQLYTDARRKAEKEAYQAYQKNQDIPELTNEHLSFAVAMDGDYYCFMYDGEHIGKTWKLTKAGWMVRPDDEMYGNIFDTYGFGIGEVSKEYFFTELEHLLDSNWFYSFVEKEKLYGKAGEK